MVKSLKEKLKNFEKGEKKGRKYPKKKPTKEERELKKTAKKLGGKIKKKEFDLTSKPIGIDIRDYKELKKEFPSVDIDKIIKNKCDYYNKKSFPTKTKKIFIQKIKKDIILHNIDGKGEEEIKEEELSPEEVKEKLREIYDQINEILREYLDLREDYYSLIALWIMGTYLHKEFKSYPYLYINAMRGSGKTRLLELISILSKDGELLTSLKEAVLFRTANDATFCIDEFERVSGKEKAGLRELLNSAYKKGMKVKRMKKQGDEQVVEEFFVYAPIAMANIWGMDEVLGDRCIPLILEKSSVVKITKKVEDFDENELISLVKSSHNLIKCSLCSVVTVKHLYRAWNNYINDKYIAPTPNYTQHKQHNTTLTTLQQESLFNKIEEKDISGRNLELFFPLFIIADVIGEEILKNILEIATRIVGEKKTEEQTESKDVMLIDFVSQQDHSDFIPVKELTEKFKEFLKEDEEEGKWTNTKWVGRALRRLNLIRSKRRLGRGVEIILDVEKAKKKILMFRPERSSETQRVSKKQAKQKELG